MRAASGLALLALTAGCSGDPTAASPEKVFADGFATPLARVTLEAADGTVVRGYDAWLAIRPVGTLVPRRAEEYREVDCAAPRAFFERVLHHPLAGGDFLLDCRRLTDPRFDFDNGRWLVHDNAGDRWYYRTWKHDAPR